LNLRSARHQREEYYGVWLPEPLVASGKADQSDALADSLTMAFMLMLETLSPIERAVFLLHNVFEFDYAEIAQMVDKSEAACRQIVSRAKARLAQSRASPKPPTHHVERIVQQFLTAQRTGSMDDLLALLTEDAVLYADGGGRVPSVGLPIRGADRISRFFVGIRRLLPANLELRVRPVNGTVGILAIVDDHIIQTMSFNIAEDRICAIYIVRNPEKLRHLERVEDLDRHTRLLHISSPRDHNSGDGSRPVSF
jgi:RNA polymerase sigma-70 factor, ECF subfamily